MEVGNFDQVWHYLDLLLLLLLINLIIGGRLYFVNFYGHEFESYRWILRGLSLVWLSLRGHRSLGGRHCGEVHVTQEFGPCFAALILDWHVM